MKKINLIIALLVVVSFAKAQNYVDLRLTLKSPSNNAYIPPLNLTNLFMTITNVGSTAFAASDSFALYLLINNDSFNFVNGTRFDNFKTIAGKAINQNDSFNYVMPFAFDNSFANMTVDLCFFIKPLNRKTKAIKDSLLLNNKACRTVNVKYQSNLNPHQLPNSLLTLMPNPASQYIKIMTPVTSGSIAIFNIKGEAVYKSDSIPTGIDCSTFSKGIYTVVLFSGEQLFTSRLILQD